MGGGTGATTAVGARANLGLGNVDNTADAAKPISAATQTALDLKANTADVNAALDLKASAAMLAAHMAITVDKSMLATKAALTDLNDYAPKASPTFTGTVSGVTKSMVGLGLVDNTSDSTKPVSIATQAALDIKSDSSYVNAALALKANAATVDSLIALKATLASPILTGVPKAPTASPRTNSTQIATTAYTDAAVALASANANTGIADNSVTSAKIVNGAVTDAKITSVSGSKITGVIPVTNGGTGQTTVAGVLTTLGFASNNVAIGSQAGTPNQGVNKNTVAIGGGAGRGNQGQSSIAIGYVSGDQNQGANSISIGGNAAQAGQSSESVAIGFAAGQTNQGTGAIAIGTFAGQSSQAANSIALNAAGSTSPLNPTTAGLFVNPIRNTTATSNVLYYNPTTKEVTSGSVPSVTSGTAITLGAISTTSNSNGASITAGVLNLAPANATDGGIVTTGAQTFAGAKTFSSDLIVNGLPIGKGSGQTNYQNISLGTDALANNTNGQILVAIGNSALYSNTTANYNIGIGVASLSQNTTGENNIGIGAASLANNNGSNNTAVGRSTLLLGSSLNHATSLGFQSGMTNTGSNNTFLGSSTDQATASSSMTNATAIGYNAKVGASNTIQLGNPQVTNVKTSGAITAGAVTYPNTNGSAGQVLTANSNGLASWTSVSGGSGPQIITEAQRDALNVTSSGVMIFNSNTNQYQGSVYYTTGYNYNYFTTTNYGFTEIRPGYGLTQTFTGKGQVITSADIAVVNMGRVSNTGNFTFAIWDETYQYALFSTTITLSGAGTVSVTIPNNWMNLPQTLPNGPCSIRITSASGSGGSADFLLNAGASAGSLSNTYWSSLGGTAGGYTTPDTGHQLAIDLFPQNGLRWVSFN